MFPEFVQFFVGGHRFYLLFACKYYDVSSTNVLNFIIWSIGQAKKHFYEVTMKCGLNCVENATSEYIRFGRKICFSSETSWRFPWIVGIISIINVVSQTLFFSTNLMALNRIKSRRQRIKLWWLINWFEWNPNIYPIHWHRWNIDHI